MKKKIQLFLLTILCVGCSSIKNHNKHLSDPIPEDDLKSDIDQTYKKIKKLHPNLYFYISKEALDFKFDSIKKTLTKPITSFDLYKKISPVVSAVRQGHMFVYPSVKQYSKKETKAIKLKGTNPLSQFEFEIFNNKMYVVKNKSYNKSIKVGTEVLAVNGQSPIDLYKEYYNRFTSDGLNTTFKPIFFSKRFSTFHSYNNGLKDSVLYSFKWKDTIKNVLIKRGIADSTSIKRKLLKQPLSATEITKIKKDKENLKKDKSIRGYDEQTKSYNRNLRFIEKDSSIAIIKIKSFSKGSYKSFYKESFKTIEKYKSKALIIDLRNNGGGRAAEIENLYAYLADSTFIFMGDAEVTSKTTLMKNHFRGKSIFSKALKIISAPLVCPVFYFLTKKHDDNKYYFDGNETKEIKKNAFKGKVYVLINGGSFSASSIISANLKGSKRATIVGQETGGAHNGTVAGIMPVIELPKSKIKIRIGLMNCVPHYKTETFGRGVTPDYEIIPTLEDRINDNDPEMNWVLDDIKKQ